MENNNYINSNRNNFLEENNDELILSKFLNFLNRKKKQIFYATFGATTLVILYTYTLKSIWQGNFKILVDAPLTNTPSINNRLQDLFTINGLKGGGSNLKETQKVLLKSQYIISDIYNNFKIKKSEKGISVNSFEEWADSKLALSFEKDSSILVVKLKDEDKVLIIKTLKEIAKKYQDYSIADKIKQTSQGINFLKNQRDLLSNNSLISLTKLNKFSIDNGIGDFDGFVGIDQNNSTENLIKAFKNSNNNTNNIYNSNLENTGAGQRFRTQFLLLENYEALYTDLSAKLKANSKTLKELKVKIDNLRNNLKRPNEILLEYRNLKRVAERDISILRQVESELSLLKFENAKKQEPWLIVSEPIIEENRISPIRSQAALTSILLSSLFSIFFIYKKEKGEGIIYDIEDLIISFPYKFLDKLFLNDKKLNTIIITNEIKNNSKDLALEKNNFGFIHTSLKSNMENNKFNILDNESLNKKFNVNLTDKSKIDECDAIFVFIEIGLVRKKELLILTKYLDSYRDKVLGWFLIE